LPNIEQLLDEIVGIIMQSGLRDASKKLRRVAKGHHSARRNVIGKEVTKPHVTLWGLPGREGLPSQSRHRNDTV
jgi:hypothetical protein